MAADDTQDQEETVEEAINDIDVNHDGKIEASEAAKHFLHSRTIIVNAVAILVMIVQSKFGFVIDQALQTEILLGINMWLRTQTTKPIKWKS